METTSTLQFGKCLLDQQDLLKSIVPYENLPIDHPPFCQLDGTSEQKKKIPFASVGVISDINSNLLVTRRTKDLTTFPLKWVFPGGKLGKSESFEDALLREVKEETGISISKSKDNKEYRYENRPCEVKPIFEYESLFPNDAIVPWSQILVIYFLVVLPFDFQNIMLNFQLQEVDAYSWISLEDFYQMIHNGEKKTIEAFFFNNKTFQFESNSIDEDRFIIEPGNLKKIEFMPHGHRTVIKIIHDNFKEQEDKAKRSKFLDK